MTQPFGRHAANTSYSDCEAAPAAGNLSHSDPGLSAVSHQQMAAVRGKKTPRPAEHGSDPQKAPCDPPSPPSFTPAIGIYKCQPVVYRVLPPLPPYMGIAGRIAGVGSISTPGVRPSQYQHSTAQQQGAILPGQDTDTLPCYCWR